MNFLALVLLAFAANALEVPPGIEQAGIRSKGNTLHNGSKQPLIEVMLAQGDKFIRVELKPALAPGSSRALDLPSSPSASVDAVIFADRTLLGPDRSGRIAASELRLRVLKDTMRDLGRAMSSEDDVIHFFTPLARKKDTPYDAERAQFAKFILDGLRDFDPNEILSGLNESLGEYPQKEGLRRP